MAKPVIAGRKPAPVNLTEGEEYYWCACGLSQNQPFCDGSHKDTGLTPVKFEPAEDGKVFFCGCKATSNAPLCDGSHSKL